MKEQKNNVCRSVFNPGIARRLLKAGNPIVDIKPKKETPDATIFLFQDTDKFRKDLDEIITKTSVNNDVG